MQNPHSKNACLETDEALFWELKGTSRKEREDNRG